MSRLREKKPSSSGFTIIEMLVVIGIMAVMVGLFTANLAGQRANRDMRIAQNELVTNLRKIQSYTLSGRKVGTTQPVKYYVAKFNTAASTQSSYIMQAMYKDENGIWKLTDAETVKLPSGVYLSAVKINGASVSCGLVAFQVPYARVYMSDGCSPSSLPSNPYPIVDGDDYKKIINFVSNTAGLTTTVNSKMSLTLVNQFDPNLTRNVEINGITGSVGF